MLQLPAEDITYSICLTQDVLAYSYGNQAALYGQGGDCYSWHEQPSFSVISKIAIRTNVKKLINYNYI